MIDRLLLVCSMADDVDREEGKACSGAVWPLFFFLSSVQKKFAMV